jgi:TolB-like protein
MSDVFISYARAAEPSARIVAEGLRAAGYGVWRDDELPAHRAYSEVIEERLRAAKAVVVIWSAEAVKSQWVRAEADLAREAGTLVQLSIDGATPPLPFNQIQCADLNGWNGDFAAPGWRKVESSVAELLGGPGVGGVPDMAAPTSLPGKPSIAVLPFVNLSGDPAQDYFADGMVTEIVTALSRIRSIFVIASGSSLSFRGKAVSPQEAAKTLGVRYVLEGSVRSAAGRVRIAVQLIDAIDRTHVWADRFEDGLQDVFALQDRVALAVAGVIEPRVQHAEIRRVAGRPTDEMGGYDLYLRALALYRTAERGAIFEALDLLGRGIALDPEYGLALALAAMCHRDVVLSDWSDDPADHRRRAVELADRALRSARDDAEVLAFAAAVLGSLEGDVDAVVALFDRAIALNPGSSTAWLSSGMLRLSAGDPDLAAQHFETSMRLDPLSPVRGRQLFGLGAARFEQERFAESAALLKQAVRLLPIPGAHALLVACYGHLGHLGEAREALARYASLGAGDIHEQLPKTLSPRQRQLCKEGLARAEGDSAGAGASV